VPCGPPARWAPDNRALAVGWRRSGLGLWSPSGCRLVCSLRQAGAAARAARAGPPLAAARPAQPLSLESGMAALAWGCSGAQARALPSGRAEPSPYGRALLAATPQDRPPLRPRVSTRAGRATPCKVRITQP